MTNEELIAALRYCAMHECCDESVLEDCKYSHKWKDGEDCNAMLLADAADALEAADKQIAELMPKEGEWIEYPDCLRYEGAYNDTFIACNQCGHVWSTIDNCTETFDYCPNCGARMRGANDGC